MIKKVKTSVTKKQHIMYDSNIFFCSSNQNQSKEQM